MSLEPSEGLRSLPLIYRTLHEAPGRRQLFFPERQPRRKKAPPPPKPQKPKTMPIVRPSVVTNVVGPSVITNRWLGRRMALEYVLPVAIYRRRRLEPAFRRLRDNPFIRAKAQVQHRLLRRLFARARTAAARHRTHRETMQRSLLTVLVALRCVQILGRRTPAVVVADDDDDSDMSDAAARCIVRAWRGYRDRVTAKMDLRSRLRSLVRRSTTTRYAGAKYSSFTTGPPGECFISDAEAVAWMRFVCLCGVPTSEALAAARMAVVTGALFADVGRRPLPSLSDLRAALRDLPRWQEIRRAHHASKKKTWNLTHRDKTRI